MTEKEMRQEVVSVLKEAAGDVEHWIDYIERGKYLNDLYSAAVIVRESRKRALQKQKPV